MTHKPPLLAICVVVLLSGCDTLEPYERPYTWRPIGTNQSNLANMVADPRDLAQGRAMGPADGVTAAAAVDRLRQNHVKALSDGANSSASSAVGGPTTSQTSN